MTPKSYWVSALCLAAWAGSSYSEDYTYGYSNNAAIGGGSWGMSGTLFPMDSIQGVDINGVFYRYTAVKNPEDPYTVSIQNEAADGSGYIFRETDDWTGGSGGTIQKFVPLPYSPLGDWGDGSIEQVGVGSVEDPVVLYSYRQTLQPIEEVIVPETVATEESIVEPVAEGIADQVQVTEISPPTKLENSSNFVLSESSYRPEIVIDTPVLPEFKPYSITNDQLIEIATEQVNPEYYEYREEPREEKEESELRESLFFTENAISAAAEQLAMMNELAKATDISSYYAVNIQGGTYQDTVILTDTKLPDNRRAYQSFANDRKHTEMVDQQYRR